MFSFTEIGVGLAGMGVAFIFLGVVLLFDKGLLAIGNVSYLIPSYKAMPFIILQEFGDGYCSCSFSPGWHSL